MAAGCDFSSRFPVLEDSNNNDDDNVSVRNDDISQISNEVKQMMIGRAPRDLSAVRHTMSCVTIPSGVDLESDTAVLGIKSPSDENSDFLLELRSGSCAEKGPKPYMEDEHICIDNLAEELGAHIVAGFPAQGAFYGKPNCRSERARIKKLGGAIDDGYLNGQLSVARAIGDWHMKGPKGSVFPLSAEPEVCDTSLTEEDEFLIMGCDGLWDVMTSQCAVTIVRN